MQEKARPVKGDGQRHELIIRWLRENHWRIDNIKKGKLTFDFAGPNLTWHLQEGPEEIKGKI